jgi:hypothetical protein
MWHELIRIVGLVVSSFMMVIMLRVLVSITPEAIREYREAEEENVLVGMTVRKDGTLDYKMKRRKKIWSRI